MKVFLKTTILLTLLIPIKSVNAEPNSCRASAITAQELESVDTLQEMYYLQSEIKDEGEILDELNYKKSQGYDSYDVNSVNEYNNLIAQYNDTIYYKNDLGEEYNQLKDIFNAQVKEISPSTNTSFVMCLNNAMLRVETKTTTLNIDGLKTSTENLRINTDNLINNTNNLRSNTETLRENTDNLTKNVETLKMNTDDFQLNL